MDLIDKFRKCDLLLQLLIICIFFVLLKVVYSIIANIFNKTENFGNISNNSTFSCYDNDNLHDNFYSKLYDKLHNDDSKNNTIINIIKNKCNLSKTSTILDIGCGTGEIVSKLSEFNIIGLDKSDSMIKICKNKFPKNNFILGDILSNSKLNYNYDFTHILCLNYTIYYIANRNDLFKNCFDLLLPNGILILHLVDKNKFNRTISACKINNFNPSKYLHNKPVKSSVDFDKFKYESIYKINDEKGIIDETFEFKDKSIRKNTHILNLTDSKNILNEATKYGFIIDGQIKITNLDGEYIYILKKNL